MNKWSSSFITSILCSRSTWWQEHFSVMVYCTGIVRRTTAELLNCCLFFRYCEAYKSRLNHLWFILQIFGGEDQQICVIIVYCPEIRKHNTAELINSCLVSKDGEANTSRVYQALFILKRLGNSQQCWESPNINRGNQWLFYCQVSKSTGFARGCSTNTIVIC